jgi:hypothetical protein
MNKNQINQIVNEYLKFEKRCEEQGITDSEDKYDEQYRIWLEQMEKAT